MRGRKRKVILHDLFANKNNNHIINQNHTSMYNNINSDVVGNIGKFVCLYETEKLRTKKDRQTKTLLPCIVDTFNATIKSQLSIRDKIKKSDAERNKKLYMQSRVRTASNLNTFLYHLRNAFAHGQIEKIQDKYFLIDYELKQDEDGEYQKTLSAYGFLLCSELESFLDKIINDYEIRH